MSGPALSLCDPVEWHSNLEGEYPGQRCCIEVGTGAERVPMEFGWCPSSESLDGFWIARHPVNQAQWQAVMGTNPSRKGDGLLHPVDSVSWHDAQKFCTRFKSLSMRLPWETEWEYACRAGTTTEFAVGNGNYLNAQLANFYGNSPEGERLRAFKWINRNRAIEQGQFPPNAWGLHDMHGQVWEWCEDRHKTFNRALRGGSWLNRGDRARSTASVGSSGSDHIFDFGFRPCLNSNSNKK